MRRSGDIAVLFMLAAGPLAVAVLQARGGFADPLLLGVLLGVLTACVLLGAALLFSDKVRLYPHPAFVFLALYSAAAFLSATVARNPILSLRASAQLLMFVAAIFLLAQVLANRNGARSAMALAAVAAGLFSVHALAQFTGRDFLSFQIPFRHEYLNGFQVYSIFGNPNLLADFLAIAFPVSLAMWGDAKRPAVRALYLICGVLGLAALGLTISRGAILGAAAGGAVYLAARYAGGARGRSALVLAVILITAGITSSALLGRQREKQESVSMRAITRGATMLMIHDNPLLGVGYDRYRHEHLTYQARYFQTPGHRKNAYIANREKQRHAHNEFLQVIAETGFVGLVPFLGFIGALGLLLIRTIMRTAESGGTAAGLLGAGAAFCVTAVFSFPLRVPETAALLAVLAACAAAASHTAVSDAPPARLLRMPNVRMRIEALLILILLAGFGAWELVIQPYLSVESQMRGESALRDGDSLRASKECLNAYRLDRDNGDAVYCLGLTMLHLDHPEDAAFNFQEALTRIDDPLIHYVYARALRQLGRFESAEKQLLLMQAMLPDHTLPRLELAALYSSMNKQAAANAEYAEALALLEREEQRLGPGFNRIMNIARLHYTLGHEAEYRMWLERANQLRPGDPAIRRALGMPEAPPGGNTP